MISLTQVRSESIKLCSEGQLQKIRMVIRVPNFPFSSPYGNRQYLLQKSTEDSHCLCLRKLIRHSGLKIEAAIMFFF